MRMTSFTTQNSCLIRVIEDTNAPKPGYRAVKECLIVPRADPRTGHSLQNYPFFKEQINQEPYLFFYFFSSMTNREKNSNPKMKAKPFRSSDLLSIQSIDYILCYNKGAKYVCKACFCARNKEWTRYWIASATKVFSPISSRVSSRPLFDEHIQKPCIVNQSFSFTLPHRFPQSSLLC